MSDTTYTITKDGGSYKVEINRLAALCGRPRK